MTTSSKIHTHLHLSEDRSSTAGKRQAYTDQDSADAMQRCYDSITGRVYHTDGWDASGLAGATVVPLSKDSYVQEVILHLARIAHSCTEVNRSCLRHHTAERPLTKACMPQGTSALGAWSPETSPEAVLPTDHDASADEDAELVAQLSALYCAECLSIVWDVLFGFEDGGRYVKGVIPVLNRLGEKSPGKCQSLAELRATINNVAIDQHRARLVSAGLPAKPAAAVSSLHLSDPVIERIVTDYFTARLASGCSHQEGIDSAAQELLARTPEGTAEGAHRVITAAIARAKNEVGEQRWHSTITDAIITRAAANPVHLDYSPVTSDDDDATSGYDLVDSQAACLIGAEPVKDPTVNPRRQNSSHATDRQELAIFTQELDQALANPANSGLSRIQVAIDVLVALAQEDSITDLMSAPFQDLDEGESTGERVRQLLRTSPQALDTLHTLLQERDRQANTKRNSRQC